MTLPAVAYSYIRFSSKKQEEGDSVRRQTELTTRWAERQGILLDATLRPDRGVSAFRGKNRDLGSLAEFLRLVESGRVLAGSYLVVESLDRLTREDIQPALLLVLNLLQKGIRVVQLKPVEMVYDAASDTTPIILMIVELSRGHSESKVKSDRVSEKWGERRKAARRGETLTKKLPAWVEERGGKRVAIPERAEAIRLIFKLSADGRGLFAVMAKLNADGVQPFGPSGTWSTPYLRKILIDRRAMGELQPRLRDGSPDGPPIADYFPAVVTPETFDRAAGAAAQRRRRPGRIGNRVNLFGGLLREARSGGTYTVQTSARKAAYDVLRSNAVSRGIGENYSFPLHVFERAVLSCLREIKPHEILDGGGGPEEVATLSGEFAALETEIASIGEEMDRKYSQTLLAVLRRKEVRLTALAKRLAIARQKAADPLSEAWGETQTLLATLDGAPDQREARLRLRSAMRRVIEDVRLLVVRRGQERLAAVQVRFHGGERVRSYLILHRPPKANGAARTEGGWWMRSLSRDAAAGELDLRDPAHVAGLAARLETFDLSCMIPDGNTPE